MCYLPKLNQQDISTPNQFLMSNEFEATIISQKRKFQDQIDLLLDSSRYLRTQMLLKLVHEIKTKGKIQNSFYNAYYPDTRTS
jgi:hypothetical protein